MRAGWAGRCPGWGGAITTCVALAGCFSSPDLIDCVDESSKGRAECLTASDGTTVETTVDTTTSVETATTAATTASTTASTTVGTTAESTSTSASSDETSDTTETTGEDLLPPPGLCQVDLSQSLSLSEAGGDHTVANGLFEATFTGAQGSMMTSLHGLVGSRTGNLIHGGLQRERYVGVEIWQDGGGALFSYQSAASVFEPYELGPAVMRAATTWRTGNLQSQDNSPTRTLFTPDGRWIRSEEPLVSDVTGGGGWFNAYMTLEPSRFSHLTSDTPDLVDVVIPEAGGAYVGLYGGETSSAAQGFDSQDTMHFCAYDSAAGYAVGFGSSSAYFASDLGKDFPIDGGGHGMRAARSASDGQAEPALAMLYDLVRNSEPPVTAYHFPLFSMIWSDPGGDPCACIAAQFDAWANPPELQALAGGEVTPFLNGLDVDWDDRDSGQNAYAEYGGYYTVDLDGSSPLRLAVSTGKLPTVLLRLEDSDDADAAMPFESTKGVEVRLGGVLLTQGVHYAIQTSSSGGLFVFLGRELSDQSELEIRY